MDNKPTLKERLQYWFDKQMSKGSFGLIRLLTFFTALAIIIVTAIGVTLGFYEDGLIADLWDSIATIINAWLPYYEDSEGSVAYLLVMTAAAICGLLITSVLIGIISNAIEEKITSLKHGNSKVLEQDHYVILGFTAGEYTLIRQLILASAGQPKCIVIGAEMDQEEMQVLIEDNVEIPKNIRLIYRNVNIFDPVSLDRLSLEACHTVIVSPADDKTTAKVLLAVSNIINHTNNDQVRVNAIISNDKYRFPDSVAKKHNVTIMQTNDVIAKIIAHSCTQPGLSDTFREIFNFEGFELYELSIPNTAGLSFEDLTCRMADAVPIGILHQGETILNPCNDRKVEEGDLIIVFARDKESVHLTESPVLEDIPEKYTHPHHAQPIGKITVLGYNESFKTVIHELPDNVTDITAEAKKKYRETIRTIGTTQKNVKINVYDKDIDAEGALLRIAKEASHIILLSDHDLSDEDADLKIIFRIMNLRDIRTRYQLHFNITAEMRKESNQILIQDDDHIDFVVSTNMSSLILAQLAESPKLIDSFNELLSIEGNEFYLKTAHQLHCCGRNSILKLRRITMMQNYILIGYIQSESAKSIFNPPIDAVIDLKENDRLIVIGID